MNVPMLVHSATSNMLVFERYLQRIRIMVGMIQPKMSFSACLTHEIGNNIYTTRYDFNPQRLHGAYSLLRQKGGDEKRKRMHCDNNARELDIKLFSLLARSGKIESFLPFILLLLVHACRHGRVRPTTMGRS